MSCERRIFSATGLGISAGLKTARQRHMMKTLYAHLKSRSNNDDDDVMFSGAKHTNTFLAKFNVVNELDSLSKQASYQQLILDK
jgi:hypothetical protein